MKVLVKQIIETEIEKEVDVNFFSLANNTPTQEIIDQIIKIDQYLADWGFTIDLLIALLKSVESDFPDCKHYERSDELKDIFEKYLEIMK